MANKIAIGVLILVILTSSIYIMLPNKVRIDVQETKSLFSVWEDGRWTLAATEYLNLFDGTTKMRAKNREVLQNVEEGIITITRTANWKDNITTIHTYVFDSTLSDVESVPVTEELTCINCVNKIVHFEYRDILYTGETKVIESPFEFGHNMKLEWEDTAYYSKVFQQSSVSDKIIVRFKPQTNDVTISIRLFDPVGDDMSVTIGEGSQITISENNQMVITS